MSPDADDLLENDKQKVQKAWNSYQSGGSWKDNINPPKLLEHVCWGLAMCAIIGMVLVLPWVGQDKLIPGTTWLGISLGLAIIFGLAGSVIRMARTGFKDADNKVSSKFERGR